jgi:aspartyl-tRNA(Asn)/glutamyl-tRNA(Gln) amidotransferase subunit A
MSIKELYKLKAHDLHNLLLKKEITAKELVESVIEHIEREDKKINAYITKTYDYAISIANKVDKKIQKKEEISPLAGIPIAIKDNICMNSVRTTCGSSILSNFIAPYDATVIKRLKANDLAIIGKTNMDEFAMGSSNENSYFGPVRNPYDTSRVPGGSSGGSAAAVTNNEAILALGSDTGGSIRQPASLCGVFGLKPTYGLVSRYGLVAFASSLDQIGPITKDIIDLANLLSIIAGHDKYDSTSLPVKPIDYSQFLKEDIKNLKIGIPKEYFIGGIEPQVKELVEKAIYSLESQGAQLINISLPHTDYAIACYYIIATSEASSNLARYDGVLFGKRAKTKDYSLDDMYKATRDEDFGKEVKRRIMLGTYALSAGYYQAYYLKALKVRRLILEDFKEAFLKVDVIITPTSPQVAFSLGEKLKDPLTMYLSDIFTISVNLAGLPAISVPCGFVKKDKNNLPVGMQIIAPHLREDLLIKVAYTYSLLK